MSRFLSNEIYIKSNANSSCVAYKPMFDVAIPSALSRSKIAMDEMESAQANGPVDTLAQLLFANGKGGMQYNQVQGTSPVLSGTAIRLTLGLGRYKSISDLVYNPSQPTVPDNQPMSNYAIVSLEPSCLHARPPLSFIPRTGYILWFLPFCTRARFLYRSSKLY